MKTFSNSDCPLQSNSLECSEGIVRFAVLKLEDRAVCGDYCQLFLNPQRFNCPFLI